MSKHILVTGGAGYIGSVLSGVLLDAGYQVTVVDRFFFGNDTIAAYKNNRGFKAIKADTRFLDPRIFKGVDTVIDLAGLSNDPSCDLAPELTESVNGDGAVAVAKMAKKAGVPRLIYASSCSVYGQGGDGMVKEGSPCYPVSLYAKCKIRVEKEVGALADKKFCVTFPRFATVYGASTRMRFDLIINIMTMHALTKRKIIVLGGGRQWRPLVHVRDVCKALVTMLKAPTSKINGQAFNVGSNKQNYRVIEVARAVQDIIPYVEVEIAPDDADKRSYNVDFSKIAKTLGFKADFDIKDGIKEIAEKLRQGDMDPTDPRTSTSKYYKSLIDAERTLNEIRLNGRVL